MYGFKLKFRNVYTEKAFTKKYEIDTCPFDDEDYQDMGFANADGFAWSQAVQKGLALALNEQTNDHSIVFEGVELLYC